MLAALRIANLAGKQSKMLFQSSPNVVGKGSNYIFTTNRPLDLTGLNLLQKLA